MVSPSTESISFHPGALSPEVCSSLVAEIEKIPLEMFVRQQGLQPERAIGDASCDYFKLGAFRAPASLTDLVLPLVPHFSDAWFDHYVINRYEPGQFIGAHIDVMNYSRNLVIPLQTGEDGISIEGVFYPDEVGRCCMMYGKTPPHEVPPVKSTRYCLVLLYE